jgi:hypothetical protein
MQMNGVGEDVNMDKSKSNMVHAAIVNNGRKTTRPGPQTPIPQAQHAPLTQAQQVQMMAMKQQQQQHQQAVLQQQQQHQQQQQQAHHLVLDRTNAIQAEGENGSSPALGQGNSPNKRPRLSPPNEMNTIPPQIPGGPQNGMPGMQNHAQIMAQQHAFALQNPGMFLKQYNVQVPPNSSHQDLQRIANVVLQQITQSQNKSVTAYKQNLAAQQSQQGMNNRNPMPSANSQFSANANRPPTEAELRALEGNAKQLGGQLQHPQAGGSHSLADYQNQLMVLEQQNKKRLQHARQETNGREEPGPGPGPQFAPPPGGGLQPGGTPLAGTSMSPSNSRTGPSPRIPNMDLQGQQRKPGQKTGSGAASPEPEGQIRGPSPAFAGPQGSMTPDLAQMGHLGGQPYPHAGLMAPNGQQLQYRQAIPGMPSFPQGQQIPVEMMKRMQQGQFPQNWPQQVPQQPFNQMNPVNHQSCS